METRHRERIIIASILLHILFLLLWEAGIILDFFKDEHPVKPPVSEPIVFDLQSPPQTPPREVIETPEDAKVVEQQKRADYLSDKNALARNPETNPDLQTGESFARGDIDSHSLPQQEGPVGQTQEPPRPDSQQSEQVEQPQKPDDSLDTYANILQHPQSIPMVPPGMLDRPPRVDHDNQMTRAEDMGGLSFNTYNWDFAPYMLALKRRIERNIFPPEAFSKWGMIDGETLLRFKIFPNGQMKDLQILKYKGHESLMLTSQNAIIRSVPFNELPQDFPEPYLEVTGKFLYFIRKH